MANTRGALMQLVRLPHRVIIVALTFRIYAIHVYIPDAKQIINQLANYTENVKKKRWDINDCNLCYKFSAENQKPAHTHIHTHDNLSAAIVKQFRRILMEKRNDLFS